MEEFQRGRGGHIGFTAAILNSGGVGAVAAPPAAVEDLLTSVSVASNPGRASRKMASRQAREDVLSARRNVISSSGEESESDTHESDSSMSSSASTVKEGHSDGDMEFEVQSLKRKATVDKSGSESEGRDGTKRKITKTRKTASSPKKTEKIEIKAGLGKVEIAKEKGRVSEKLEKEEAPAVQKSPETVAKKKTSAQSAFAKAKELESEVFSLCMDLAKDISREQANFLARKVSAMSGLIQELLLRNSFLEGRLEAEERGRAVQAIRPAQGRSQSRGKVGGTSGPEKRETGVLSYSAAVAAGKTTSMASTVRQVIKKTVKKPEKNVVEIFPENGVSSEKTKEDLFTLVNPRKSRLKVKNVRKIKDNGIAIEMEDKEGLAALLGNEKLANAGLKVATATKRRPRLHLYDVPRQMEESEILSSIKKQNLDDMSSAKVAEELRLAFRTGAKTGETVNWVIEVTPEMRSTLLLKKRLYIGWRSCRVADFAEATRCFKCQAFGHIAKFCRKEKEVCGHCGEEGHSFLSCKEKSKAAVCVNCKSRGKPFDHETKDKKCSMYRAALTRTIAETNYG